MLLGSVANELHEWKRMAPAELCVFRTAPRARMLRLP
jgi:ethanolamine ammonia-lyase small subunit